VGTSRIFEKWVKALGIEECSFISREYLADFLALETGIKVNVVFEEDYFLIDGRFLPDARIVAEVPKLRAGEGISSNGEMVVCRIDGKRASESKKEARGSFIELINTISSSVVEKKKIEVSRLDYLWDFMNINGEIIENEFSAYRPIAPSRRSISEKAELIKPERIAISENAAVGPSVVIDASAGPVIIERDVIIEPFTYIQGPSYIGPGCRIVGGRIRGGCSIGPVCRVGGEIEETIMLGHCNKYHEGFLGHAYLGEWVNLGASTTNSDLKNNYAGIKVDLQTETVETGHIKIGCFIGDHTKTGIGTMLNTGISVGFSCNLFGSGLFSQKRIPSFSWGTPGEQTRYRLEKAVQTAKASMSRRGEEFSEAHSRLFNGIMDIDGKF